MYEMLFMLIAEVPVVVVCVGKDEPLAFVVTGELVYVFSAKATAPLAPVGVAVLVSWNA